MFDLDGPVQDVTDALGKLAALGSPNQIADHLAERGIGGMQYRTRQCPVARYVDATAGLQVNVINTVWSFPEVTHMASGYHPVPDVVTAFVRGFDNGDYPHLIQSATG
jgi:hypothetical protein